MQKRCENCGVVCSGIATKKFCSYSCRKKALYKRRKKQIIKRNLAYYYKNRKGVLAYQIARIERLRKENPEFHKKYNARHTAEQEVDLKGKICERCHKRKARFRHHEDYSKPLEVILCCRKCHKILDKKKGVGKNQEIQMSFSFFTYP
jgi:hypothetical protein